MKTEVGRYYVHLKTGGIYLVLGFAKIEKTMEDAVIYFGHSGYWIRPKAEFEDGRFEAHDPTGPIGTWVVKDRIAVTYDWLKVELEFGGINGAWFFNQELSTTEAREIAAHLLQKADSADKMRGPGN